MAELTPPLAAPVAPPPATDAELIRESLTTPERFASVFDRHASALHRLLRALSQASPPADSEPMDVQAIDRIAARAVRGLLLRALADLPVAHRDALLLVASGLSYEQTAAALGVPLGTVASRLSRARRKVRAALGGTNPIDSAGD